MKRLGVVVGAVTVLALGGCGRADHSCEGSDCPRVGGTYSAGMDGATATGTGCEALTFRGGTFDVSLAQDGNRLQANIAAPLSGADEATLALTTPLSGFVGDNGGAALTSAPSASLGTSLAGRFEDGVFTGTVTFSQSAGATAAAPFATTSNPSAIGGGFGFPGTGSTTGEPGTPNTGGTTPATTTPPTTATTTTTAVGATAAGTTTAIPAGCTLTVRTRWTAK